MAVKVDKLLTEAPDHLSLESKRWWCQVQEQWILEDHHIRLLTLSAEAWDRCQQAREILDKEGLVVLDRFKQKKVHPCVSIERDSRIAFARLLRELALDISAPGDSRPPDYTKMGVGT